MIKYKDRHRLFTTFEIVKSLKIKRERLRKWLENGYIVPKIHADGHGTKNLFTIWELYQIELFRYLVDHGFSRGEAAMYSQGFNRAYITSSAIRKFSASERVGSENICDRGKDILFLKLSQFEGRTAIDFVLGGEYIKRKRPFDIDCDAIHLINMHKIMGEVDRAF